MTRILESTIAQLVCADAPLPSLAALVAELDAALDRSAPGGRKITWDHDDFASVETAGLRFCLGTAALDRAACLTVSVGPVPDGTGDREELTLEPDALCRLIVRRLESRLDPDRVVWHRHCGEVTAEDVDGLVEAMEALSAPVHQQSTAPTRHPQPDSARRGRTVVRRTLPPLAPADRPHGRVALLPQAVTNLPANDQPDLPLTDDARLASVRMALYPAAEAEERPSPQMRLAAHSLDATMILVALPVGAAMMTYSLLRGGNMAVSARMTAVTCTAFGLMQSPAAAHILQML